MRRYRYFPLIAVKFLLFLLLSFVTVEVKAQRYNSADSARIYKLLDAADDIAVKGTLDSAMHLANLAWQLSKEKKMLRGEGFSLLKIADISVQRSDSNDAEGLLADALKIGTQLRDSFIVALAYYQRGQYYMYKELYGEAEDLFKKSLATKFEKDQSSHTAVVYNDMGYLFGKTGELEKQVNWYLKAIRIYEKAGEMTGLATTTANLGAAYYSLGKTEEAIIYMKEAVAMRQKLGAMQGLATTYGNLSSIYAATSLDSAIKYQELATKCAERNGLKISLVQGYTNMSLLMNRQKKTAEALEYIKKAIAICRELNDKTGLADRTRWAAILSADLKDSAATENYYQEAYQLASALQNKTLLRDIFGSKAVYYKNKNDFERAYDNLKKYYLYRDSLINEKTATNIAELQTKYETEKKDNEIASLNTDEKIKQLEIEKQKAIITGNLLEAKQKQNEIDLLSKSKDLQDLRLKQQGEELEKQLLISKNNEQQLKLAEKDKQLKERQLQNQKLFRDLMIAAIAGLVLLGFVLFNRIRLKKRLEQQEALIHVRNNISRDLHDEIGSTLSSINILSAVSQRNIIKDKEQAAASMQQITEQSRNMQQAMSDIVWAIRPDNDRLESMAVRMREFVSHTLEPKGITTLLDIDKNILQQSLAMEQRRDFFLIFKEAVNNAAKYSDASNVGIKLSRNNGFLELSVRDDGKGFDSNKITSSNGLKNMKERAHALRGSLHISSVVGKGALVLLKIPAT
ncbi:MAG: tetratricopeptide repeat protein [Bacteroidota bacterium]|nr:tetratricopeptide repeat protein [Bacteroidota bacterium]